MLKFDFIIGLSSGQKEEALLAGDASWPVLGCNKRLAVCMCVFYSAIKELRLTTSNLVVSLKDVHKRADDLFFTLLICEHLGTNRSTDDCLVPNHRVSKT